MNDYFLKILARQRHGEILNECEKGRHLQLEPSSVSCETRVIGMFRHFLGQWRKPVTYRVKATDDGCSI